MAEKEAQKRYRMSVKGRKKMTEYQKHWSKTDKGKTCAKKHRSKNKDNIKKYNKKYYKNHRELFLSKHYEKRYGLTIEQRKDLYFNQNGCCILCGEPTPYDKICTEHSHKTGKVRGLTCYRCNTFIGYIETNSQLVPKILTYLEAELHVN